MNYVAGFILGAIVLVNGMKNPDSKAKRNIPPYLITTRQGTELEARDINITPGFYFPEDTPSVWGANHSDHTLLTADKLESTDFIKNFEKNKEIWGLYDNGRRYVPLDSLASIVVTDAKTVALEDASTGEKFSLSSGTYTYNRWQLDMVDLQGNKHQFAFKDISSIIFPAARR